MSLCNLTIQYLESRGLDPLTGICPVPGCEHPIAHHRDAQSQADYSRNYFPVFEPRQATNTVGTLIAEGRARLMTVFGPQHTHLPPRGVMFDDDFMTTSEFVQRLADLKNQHCAFVDAFARALRKMKDAEKAMLGEEDKCSLCDRMDLSGYQCGTCHQWVCEFCFPQVMRSEVRTTVVVGQDGVEEIHLKCPFCRDMFHEAIGPFSKKFRCIS